MQAASLDTWTTLFLIVSVLGLWLTVMLFNSPGKRRVNIRIGLILLGFSLILIQYVFFWSGYDKVYPYVHFFDSAWYLLFGPLMFSYIQQFFKKDYRIGLAHYIPAVFAFAVIAIYMFRTNGFSNFTAVREEFGFFLYGIAKNPWVAIISLLIYQLFIWDLIKNNSAEPSKAYQVLRAKWTRLLAQLFGVFTLAYASYYILVRFEFFNPYWDYAISISMSLAIYAIGYFAYKEPDIFNGTLFKQLFVKNSHSSTNGYNSETRNEFYNDLIQKISSEQSFLDADLRLAHLADQMNLSTHDLSQIINTEAGVNFNTFINNFRLEEATHLLTNNPSESIKSICFKAGFNSKSAFYKAFKATYGCSPQEYQGKHS